LRLKFLTTVFFLATFINAQAFCGGNEIKIREEVRMHFNRPLSTYIVEVKADPYELENALCTYLLQWGIVPGKWQPYFLCDEIIHRGISGGRVLSLWYKIGPGDYGTELSLCVLKDFNESVTTTFDPALSEAVKNDIIRFLEESGFIPPTIRPKEELIAISEAKTLAIKRKQLADLGMESDLSKVKKEALTAANPPESVYALPGDATPDKESSKTTNPNSGNIPKVPSPSVKTEVSNSGTVKTPTKIQSETNTSKTGISGQNIELNTTGAKVANNVNSAQTKTQSEETLMTDKGQLANITPTVKSNTNIAENSNTKQNANPNNNTGNVASGTSNKIIPKSETAGSGTINTKTAPAASESIAGTSISESEKNKNNIIQQVNPSVQQNIVSKNETATEPNVSNKTAKVNEPSVDRTKPGVKTNAGSDSLNIDVGFIRPKTDPKTGKPLSADILNAELMLANGKIEDCRDQVVLISTQMDMLKDSIKILERGIKAVQAEKFTLYSEVNAYKAKKEETESKLAATEVKMKETSGNNDQLNLERKNFEMVIDRLRDSLDNTNYLYHKALEEGARLANRQQSVVDSLNYYINQSKNLAEELMTSKTKQQELQYQRDMAEARFQDMQAREKLLEQREQALFSAGEQLVVREKRLALLDSLDKDILRRSQALKEKEIAAAQYASQLSDVSKKNLSSVYRGQVVFERMQERSKLVPVFTITLDGGLDETTKKVMRFFADRNVFYESMEFDLVYRDKNLPDLDFIRVTMVYRFSKIGDERKTKIQASFQLPDGAYIAPDKHPNYAEQVTKMMRILGSEFRE